MQIPNSNENFRNRGRIPIDILIIFKNLRPTTGQGPKTREGGRTKKVRGRNIVDVVVVVMVVVVVVVFVVVVVVIVVVVVVGVAVVVGVVVLAVAVALVVVVGPS